MPQVMNDLAESQLKYYLLYPCVSPLYRGNGTIAMIVTQLLGSLVVRWKFLILPINSEVHYWLKVRGKEEM